MLLEHGRLPYMCGDEIGNVCILGTLSFLLRLANRALEHAVFAGPSSVYGVSGTASLVPFRAVVVVLSTSIHRAVADA